MPFFEDTGEWFRGTDPNLQKTSEEFVYINSKKELFSEATKILAAIPEAEAGLGAPRAD